jgi:hypothetical protein
MTTGRHSRADRLSATHIGVWSTSSQDYVVLATELHRYSKRAATQHRGNASAFAFAGIPLLFSALRALLIECNSGVYGVDVNHAALRRLARDPNEIALLQVAYGIGPQTIEQLCLVYEVRNEIVHPSHRPSGTPDSTPDYIRPLKALGVLETTGDRTVTTRGCSRSNPTVFSSSRSRLSSKSRPQSWQSTAPTILTFGARICRPTRYTSKLIPNSSLERTANGMAPGPRGIGLYVAPRGQSACRCRPPLRLKR